MIRFLNRSEDLRTVADGIKDREMRSDVLKWAEACEQTARQAMESGKRVDRR